MGLPLRWGRQILRNWHDVVRVLDLIQFRPMPAGLVSLRHPWVTGIDPESGESIWPKNVVFSSPRAEGLSGAPGDEAILTATGRFMAHRVWQSAVLPEIPQGPKRRMPHAINYMHGSSHYNSGIILLNDLEEGYRHLTDCRFRMELERFVRTEGREVLIVFRDRHYAPRDFAVFSCCLRLHFAWFCNPNGPQGNVLWGNFAPFPSANLITGHWARDAYALLKPDGAQAVVRPPIARNTYFVDGNYGVGCRGPRWPETLLAWLNYHRVRLRHAKGGMYFVDRRRAYSDQIDRRMQRGEMDHPQAEWSGSRSVEADRG